MSRDRGGLALAILGLIALVARRGGRGVVPGVSPIVEDWGTGWTWPVPDLRMGDPPNDIVYPAVISQEYREGAHRGVDIMYRRLTADDRPEWSPKGKRARDGFTNGSGMYFAPPGTPIHAARAGVVWSVGKTARGWEIVLDHGKDFATYYGHVTSPAFKPHARGKPTAGGEATVVHAGQVIGLMGGDPSKPPHLRHLHFEVWYRGAGDKAVDLGNASRSPMLAWERTQWTP